MGERANWLMDKRMRGLMDEWEYNFINVNYF